MTRAELLERLQPALAVIGEILVDLVEARLAELPPAPAAAASPDHRALVAAVIAELRGDSPAMEPAVPPAPSQVRGPRLDPPPSSPPAEIEARAAEMAARYAKRHGTTLTLAAIKLRCATEDVARAWARLYPTEERRAVP